MVSKKTFGLNSENECITGLKNKEKYMEYQDGYRNQYGVYPELDRINNPFTARWDDLYNMMCAYRKSGVDGALFYHDLHARFRKHLKKIYASHGNEWSFLLTLSLEHRSTLVDIPQLKPGEKIVNNLGYRVDEEGNYFEGTWKNGTLIYGLVYLSNSNIFYVGSFDESGRSDCQGVAINLGKENKNKRQISTVASTFRLKNGTLTPFNSNCLITQANIKNETFESIDMHAGQYIDGYAEGLFINKEISDNIRVGWEKYKNGEVKSSLSSWEMILRMIMALYMLMWYMIKYSYGLLFLILPLYYHFRKKNWRI